jgi:predicted 2-oxoglutarate/Fe(II)-dependent dioxygenase YbiX
LNIEHAGKKMLDNEFKSLINQIKSGVPPLPFCTPSTEIPAFLLPTFRVRENSSHPTAHEITVPVTSADLEILKSMSTRAPYGKGFETLVDREVRDTLQISSENVEVNDAFAQELLRELLKKMGIEEQFPVKGNLYKLLVYSENGHFIKHRDTEKEKGMFATMIIQIPCEEGYEGGDLVIQHNGRRETVDLRLHCQTHLSAVLLYADCEHELKPMTKGHRVVLAYNIIATQGCPMNMMVNNSDISKLIPLEAFMQKWKAAAMKEAKIDGKSLFRCIPLEHQYTKQNLSFMGLKGKDSKLANLLLKCSDLQVFLILQCKHETGMGYDEYCRDNENEDWCVRTGYWEKIDEEESEPKEYFFEEENYSKPTSTYSLDYVIGQYGSVLASHNKLQISVENDPSMNSEEWFKSFGVLPVRQKLEPSGNEGVVSLEKWYYSAQLMIAPKDLFFQYFNERDTEGMIEFISKSLIAMHNASVLMNIPWNNDGKETIGKYLTLIFDQQKPISMKSIQLLLSVHEFFVFPEVFCHVPDLLSDKGLNELSEITSWSSDLVLALVQCLVPLGDSVFLHHVRDVLLENCNTLDKDCLLHQFLFLTPELWIEVERCLQDRESYPHFWKFLKDLFVGRTNVLKEFAQPEMNTWAFPLAEVGQERELKAFLVSPSEETKEFVQTESTLNYFLSALEEEPKNFSTVYETVKEKATKERRYAIIKVTVRKTRDYSQKQLELYEYFQRCISKLESELARF